MQIIFDLGGWLRICEGLLERISEFLHTFPKVLDDIEDCSQKSHFQERTVDIGIISTDDALDWGLSGPLLRATDALGTAAFPAL